MGRAATRVLLSAAVAAVAAASHGGPSVEFGLYDYSADPGGGWRALSLLELRANKAEFVKAYNERGGVAVIKAFRSGNCCIALAGGEKLIVSGTPYGHQFPSALSGGSAPLLPRLLRCCCPLRSVLLFCSQRSTQSLASHLQQWQ